MPHPNSLLTTEERFMMKVEISESCWRWTAYVAPKGYGRFALDGISRMAHQVAYELFVGAIPEGCEIDHLCRNRACVNPEHLEAVTHLVNVRRAMTGLCKRGHELDVVYRGGRYCKTCRHMREGRTKRLAS